MKKLFIVLCLSMFFVLGSVSVFAYSQPNETKFLVYLNNSDGFYYYLDSNENVNITYKPTENTFSVSSGGLYRYKWSDVSNTWVFYDNGFANLSSISKTIVASDHNIINFNTGAVFFSVPLAPTPTSTPLPVLVQAHLFGNLTTVFGDSLPILLTLGLVVLSILLGVSLIPRLLRLFL